MNDKELKKLRRSELLEMLIEQIDENKKLKEQLHAQEEQLKDRKIMIDKAGSIAEAALSLNGIFEVAQQAAQQYLENIQRLSEEKSGPDKMEDTGNTESNKKEAPVTETGETQQDQGDESETETGDLKGTSQSGTAEGGTEETEI